MELVRTRTLSRIVRRAAGSRAGATRGMRDPRSPRTAAWLLCFTWLVACSSWPLAAVSRGLRQDPGTPVPSPSPATDGSGGTGDGSGGTADPAPVDCAKFVDHCGACRFQSFGGTVTRAICMRCDIGYEVKNSGRDCCEPSRCEARADRRSQPPARYAPAPAARRLANPSHAR